MGKIFTEKLKMKEGIYSALQSYANLYRILYNKALTIQLVHKDYASSQSYNNCFMSCDEVLNCIKNEKGRSRKITEVLQDDFLALKKAYPEKYDKGIETAAVRKAVIAFHSWWKKCLTNLSASSIHLKPRFIDNLRDNPYFYTDTEIISTRRGFIYVSNIGRIQVRDLGCIPDGKYKNAQFKISGKSWMVSLESIEDLPVKEKDKKEKPLIDNLEVIFYSDGSLQIGENGEVPSILVDDGYQKAFLKVVRYEKIHSKKIQSNEISYMSKVKSRNKLNYLRNKLKSNLRICYNTIANNIIKARPAKIEMIAFDYDGDRLQNFKTGKYRSAKIGLLASIIKKKADLNDVKVVLRGIDPSIFELEKS